MDERIEQPVREDGRADENRAAQLSRVTMRIPQVECAARQYGPCDAGGEAVRIGKDEFRLMRAREVDRQRDRLPAQQHEGPEQEVEQHGGSDEDADVDPSVGPSECQSRTDMACEHGASYR